MNQSDKRHGGARKGAGRPPGSTKPNARRVARQIKWTAEEWGEVEAAAANAGLTVSEYQRRRILEEKP